jgi:hypothetical protein
MSIEITKSSPKQVDFSLNELNTWAPQLVEEVENYPTYWALKGWRCFISS